jgi:hypothetical protein
LGVEITNRNGQPFADECLGGGPADPAGGSGDSGHPSAQRRRGLFAT